MSEYMKSLFEYHDLIEAIVLSLKNRDIHTLHHSRRVSNMTEYICHIIGLAEEQTELYHIAANLHDIGKIGVCDAVLLKDGSLSDAEWKQMRATFSLALPKIQCNLTGVSARRKNSSIRY